jgi:hypothetical protein
MLKLKVVALNLISILYYIQTLYMGHFREN